MEQLAYVIGIGCLIGAMAGCAGEGDNSSANAASTGTGIATGERIGVYDSRSVAIAFAGSEKHEARTKAELAALKKAKEQGDKATIQQADEVVWESRRRLHRQGFGTAPVEDILALYPQAVKALKERRQLSALVSRWDKQARKRHAGAKQIDVTAELIELPGPTDRQRKSATAIQKIKPLTDAQLQRVLKQKRH